MAVPKPRKRHHWWRRRLRHLRSVDFWLALAISVVGVLGLLALVRTFSSSFATCVAGVNC